MTTWKKTKKRRAQKAQEQKQAAASAARYEETLRARQAAEEASWERQREMIEARQAANLAAFLNTRNRDQRDSEGPGEAAEFTSAHSHCSMNQYEVCQGNQPPGTLCCVHCGHECGGFSGGGQ
jgi:hypothetical protein